MNLVAIFSHNLIILIKYGNKISEKVILKLYYRLIAFLLKQLNRNGIF
jgi:hypothetical protein